MAKLSLKSVEGGYKIMIIWHAEKMNQQCANALLKLLEEPPAGTVFILTTDAPEQMLETILSRTQRIDFKRIPAQEIAERLQGPGYQLDPDTAQRIAHLSGGSWLKAISKQQLVLHAVQLLGIVLARGLRHRPERDLAQHQAVSGHPLTSASRPRSI